MLCQNGFANGRQIVPAQWISDTLNANEQLFESDKNIGKDRGGYRNQFWIRDVGRQIMMARGVFGQLIYVDLDHDLVIARLSTWPEFVSNERKHDDMLAVDAITNFLGNSSHD
jgi:CubicO group peptidase (beta-lactamase class C family)